MAKRITVERYGSDKISLKGWIGSQTPGLCKSIPGARWKPELKIWLYPLDWSTCLELRRAFGDELSIGPELNAWAREERARREQLTELAGSSSAELVNVAKYAPTLAAAMNNRPYQQVGAAFGARMGSFGLFDAPRIGKTIQTLGTIVEALGDVPGMHLVLCPKTAVDSVWGPEVRQWLGDAAVAYELTGDRARREAVLAEAFAADDLSKGKHVFVIGNIEMARLVPWMDKDGEFHNKIARDSYEQLGKYKRPTGKIIETGAEYPELFSRTWDTIIVDESHRALVRTIGKNAESQQRRGLTALKGKRRIALSGTPMRGKPHYLWGTLNWLRPDLYTGFWKWAERYFTVKSNGFSNYVLGKPEDGDFYRPGGEERLAADLRSISLRRTREEVRAEMPATVYAGTYLIPGDDDSPHGVWLTMDGAQRKSYNRFAADGSVELDGGELVAVGHLAEATRCKQLAGASLKMSGGKPTPTLPSVKFEWLMGLLDELGIVDGEGDAKIVVGSQFTSLLKLFAAELTRKGIAVHLLTGETPSGKRKAMIEDFQNTDAVRVFLLNTKAGGVAVTLHRARDLVVLDEIAGDTSAQEQLQDRIENMAREHEITIHYVRVLDTIEEELAWVAAAGEDVLAYLLDGSRGVEAARKLYEAKVAA